VVLATELLNIMDNGSAIADAQLFRNMGGARQAQETCLTGDFVTYQALSHWIGLCWYYPLSVVLDADLLSIVGYQFHPVMSTFSERIWPARQSLLGVSLSLHHLFSSEL